MYINLYYLLSVDPSKREPNVDRSLAGSFIVTARDANCCGFNTNLG